MAKIFVSYKYRDDQVRPLPGVYGATTVRDYVNLLAEHLTANGHIYKGEEEGEDLSGLSDEYIESLLRDRMFDSTVTIVLISRNMKEAKSEREQWIPWEISYSLKEQTREDRTSHANAILAVVVPDSTHSYEYFVRDQGCLNGCRTWETNSPLIFKILGKNMFNRNEQKIQSCANHGQIHVGNDHSYAHPVKWDDFLRDINGYISLAVRTRENIEHYVLEKTL